MAEKSIVKTLIGGGEKCPHDMIWLAPTLRLNPSEVTLYATYDKSGETGNWLTCIQLHVWHVEPHTYSFKDSAQQSSALSTLQY